MDAEEPEEAEEEVDGSVKEQIDCYRDASRICGPDCVAWVTNPPVNKGGLTFTQYHCLLLSTAERMARHVTGIAAALANIHTKAKTDAQDRERKDAMSPVSGGPFSDPFPSPKAKS